MLETYYKNKIKYKEFIVMIKFGNFYEMFDKDAVIASNTKLDKEIAKKYETEEQKEPVIIDYEELEKVGVELIEDDLIIVEDNILRHNSLKLSSLIFSYLMRD